MDDLALNSGNSILSITNSSFEAQSFPSTGKLHHILAHAFGVMLNTSHGLKYQKEKIHSVYGTKGDVGLRNARSDSIFTCICFKKNYDPSLLHVEIGVAVAIILILTLTVIFCIRLIRRRISS